MHATRVRLRRLLSALIAEREDSQLLYIPHGEPGMRRMIAALLVCLLLFCWTLCPILPETSLRGCCPM